MAATMCGMSLSQYLAQRPRSPSTIPPTMTAGDGEECETDAHDDGEAGADFPDRVELDERADACDNHAVLDKRGGEAFFNPDDVCKDDDRRNVTYEHGEHVLQAEWNCL